MESMTLLALTPERRKELAEMLADEERLRAEYPKVADYMAATLRMPGTGDDLADAAFELRFLHYATGGGSSSMNPYWDIVAPSVFEHQGRRVVNGNRQDGSTRLAFAQVVLQELYAYAIPSPETIEWISGFCGDRSILEIGAGRGYWAAQLSNVGLVVDAYDIEPPDKIENISFPRNPGHLHVWHEVNEASDYSVKNGHGSDHVLFLCWPPGWGNTMASEALASFEKAGGERLVYIGEPKGGKTGDDAFFDALSANWKMESVDPRYVSWWSLADTAQGWVRA